MSKEVKETRKNDGNRKVNSANTDGGTLYIGISDDGKVIGLDNPDFVMQQTANALKDGIKPDVMRCLMRIS